MCAQNKFKGLYSQCILLYFSPVFCNSYFWSFTCHWFTFISACPYMVGRRRRFHTPSQWHRHWTWEVQGAGKSSKHKPEGWAECFCGILEEEQERCSCFGKLIKENGRIMYNRRERSIWETLSLSVWENMWCIFWWLNSYIPTVIQVVTEQLVPKPDTAGSSLPEVIDGEVFRELSKRLPLPLALISNKYPHTWWALGAQHVAQSQFLNEERGNELGNYWLINPTLLLGKIMEYLKWNSIKRIKGG